MFYLATFHMNMNFLFSCLGVVLWKEQSNWNGKSVGSSCSICAFTHWQLWLRTENCLVAAAVTEQLFKRLNCSLDWRSNVSHGSQFWGSVRSVVELRRRELWRRYIVAFTLSSLGLTTGNRTANPDDKSAPWCRAFSICFPPCERSKQYTLWPGI